MTQTADEWCARGADRIVDRLETFLADLPDVPIEDFLALEDIDGLTPFQNDVAAIIAETTDQSSTLCDLDGLQQLVGVRINDVERDGLLAEFLIATIRDGRELTIADLSVAPGDDVESVLGLLEDGSTLTFAPGTYELQRPLLVARSITFIGASSDTTTVTSSAADAAIVVVGRGELIMRDLRVEHVGNRVASVVLSFDRPVDLRDVHLSGGLADDEGGAGNGLVLTDETLGGTGASDAAKPRSVVVSSIITGNTGAGIAISGALQPRIEDVEITQNGVRGICFFGDASGEVLGSSVHENDFGIQIGDDASPLIEGNTVSDNVTAGMVVLGTAAPVIKANTFAANVEVAIAIQEAAAPSIERNLFQANSFGISVLSTGAVEIKDNDITGGEVGLQVDEASTPVVENNRFTATTAVGMAVTGQASGMFIDNQIDVAEGVGMVLDVDAAPTIAGLTVIGGAVAIAYTGSSAGSMTDASFTGQDIGIQLDDQANPQITLVTMRNLASAGIVARGAVAATISDVRIEDAGEVGFALADMAEVTLTRIEVLGGPTGGSIIGTSTATVEESMFVDNEVGIQIGEQAIPTLRDNDIIRATSAGLVFVGESAGSAQGNRIREPGIVGIQLGENAAPELDANVLFKSQPEDAVGEAPGDVSDDATDGDSDDAGQGSDTTSEDAVDGASGDSSQDPVDASGDGSESAADDGSDSASDDAIDDGATVGILYAGETAGTASNNQIIGFVIGVQAGESSMPEIIDNTVDAGVIQGVGILFRDDAAGAARRNTTSGHAVGFQVGDTASPVIDANTVNTASNVAFLVQGAASPELTNNLCPDGLAGIGLLNGTDPIRSNNSCVEVIGEG